MRTQRCVYRLRLLLNNDGVHSYIDKKITEDKNDSEMSKKSSANGHPRKKANKEMRTMRDNRLSGGLSPDSRVAVWAQRTSKLEFMPFTDKLGPETVLGMFGFGTNAKSSSDGP